jgi:hypothetical protein
MNFKLSNYIDSIREIYYADGRGKLLTYKPVRKLLLIGGIIVFVTIFFWIIAINSNSYIFTSVMGFIIVVFYSIYVVKFCIEYLKWKKSVESFIAGFKEFNFCDLKLTDNSFEMSADQESIIEKWSDLKEIRLHSDYISFQNNSGHSFIFPAKSMLASDFLQLVEIVKSKVK